MGVQASSYNSLNLGDVSIDNFETSAFRIPTDGPDSREADGTLEWNSTTLVLVELQAAGKTGIGFTYADVGAAELIDAKLKKLVDGKNPLLVSSLWRDMRSELRNSGQRGAGAMAISAVDIALWDLKAALLELPLFLR